jgi:lipopolysaccharide transport system ATP-binding protein
MSIVLAVDHVSKTYRLGSIGGATLKEDVSRWWAKARGKPDPSLTVGQEHRARRVGDRFKALDDVSFSVSAGEVLGIIGRNGAGKSTLLKILSQVTAPSSGEIKIKGRIASLLEVGTGFHPELTGRENVFLNGAILGMTKAEVRRNFDEIVAFSGLSEFIDTPVKRYSSGMYVRLAFAVAAHLEPEILVVDEVLAVGDTEFQNRCIGKMQDVSRNGRTVLFVSHTMQAVTSLCTRAILMDSGSIARTGTPREIVDHYLGTSSRARFIGGEPSPASSVNRILKAWMVRTSEDQRSTPDTILPAGEEVELIVHVSVGAGESPYVVASFWDEVQRPLWEILCRKGMVPARKASEIRMRMRLPDLASSVISVHLAIGVGHSFDDYAPEAFSFTVKAAESGDGGSGRFPLIVKSSCSVQDIVVSQPR